jgi:hypothetical protein
MPIGDGTKTGKLSNPVSDNSQNGIDMEGRTNRPTLARDDNLAFLTFHFTERLFFDLFRLTSLILAAIDPRRRKITIGVAHALAIFPLLLNSFRTYSISWVHRLQRNPVAFRQVRKAF